MESVVGALVEVMHAFTTGGRDILPLLCKLYVRMLLFEVFHHIISSFATRVVKPFQQLKLYYFFFKC